MTEVFLSPLITKYSTLPMQTIFSEHHRYLLWRKLWIALAESEKKLGLPITDEQIEEMKDNFALLDLEKVREYERQTKHEVMANILAFGEQCPKAKAIIHLGCTSAFVMDNSDLIQIKEALELLLDKVQSLLHILTNFCETNSKRACLGYTHFQPAQPTTIGKRFSSYLQDLLEDYFALDTFYSELCFLGARGAVGTENSFNLLFDFDSKKVEKLNRLLASEFGFHFLCPIVTQTYPRKVDSRLSTLFSQLAVTLNKMGTDIRLLSHTGELREAFSDTQVGSSAMPYKKNPIYSERLCALSRQTISLASSMQWTAANQWLERSLDDSAARRIALPELFLYSDAILTLATHIVSHLNVNEAEIEKRLSENRPKFLQENLLMILCLKGHDRQEVHEKLKKLPSGIRSLEEMIKELKISLNAEEIARVQDPNAFIGLAEKQVHQFLSEHVKPILKEPKNPVEELSR